MSEPIPGWYPDPHDESRIRYWDGAAWTSHTAEALSHEGASSGNNEPGADASGAPEAVSSSPVVEATERLNATGASSSATSLESDTSEDGEARHPTQVWKHHSGHASPSLQNPRPSAPPAAPAKPETPRTKNGLVLAGRRRRIAALALDHVLIGLLCFAVMPLLAPTWWEAYNKYAPSMADLADGVSSPSIHPQVLQFFGALFLLMGFTHYCYEAWLTSRIGATLGKRLMGLQVVKGDTTALLSLVESGQRALLKLLYALLRPVPFLSSIALLWAFFNMGRVLSHPQRQGWHDHLVDSQVVTAASVRECAAKTPEVVSHP